MGAPASRPTADAVCKTSATSAALRQDPQRGIVTQAPVVYQPGELTERTRALLAARRERAGMPARAQLPVRLRTSANLPVVEAPATSIVSCVGAVLGFKTAKPVSCRPFRTA